MDDDILATVHVSAPRRAFGVTVLAALGLILVYIALARPPSNPAWAVFLVAMGGAALWAGQAMWRATAARLELTRRHLRSSDGTVIAPLSDIRSIDRGMFAFKPSSGFMLRLARPRPFSWQPGLWWALRDRVGIGGTTSAAQTKAMAEILSALLEER